MRILLVNNPAASSVTPRSRVVIQKALSADHDLTVADTARRGHASRLARGAAADGFEVVVALGGDGTLNEAANGLVGTDCALAVLPGGSTNVFARTLGCANDPVDATGQLLEALAARHHRRVGLGSANGRFFCFHVGAGFDAEAVHQVELRGGLKRYAGHPLFMASAVKAFSHTYERRRPRFRVRMDDHPEIRDARLCVVQNTDPYTFLGNKPLHTCTEATLDRRLGANVVRNLDLVRTLWMIGGTLHHGLQPSRNVRRGVDLTSVDIEGYGPFPYQVDGDYLGEVEHLRIRYVPDALLLVLPVGYPSD